MHFQFSSTKVGSKVQVPTFALLISVTVSNSHMLFATVLAACKQFLSDFVWFQNIVLRRYCTFMLLEALRKKTSPLRPSLLPFREDTGSNKNPASLIFNQKRKILQCCSNVLMIDLFHFPQEFRLGSSGLQSLLQDEANQTKFSSKDGFQVGWKSKPTQWNQMIPQH